MPGTMDKADVKLSFEPLADVDWTEVAKVMGKSVPQVCKTVVQEVLDGIKTKKYKKPYGKVGLIKKDLYFRIKDGNTHVDDVLLVKNWSEPEGGEEEELSPAQERALNEWIQSRKDLLQIVEDGLADATNASKNLARDCGLIEEYLNMAKAGLKGQVTGLGLASNADKAKDLLVDIKTAVEAVQRIHDVDVFPTYDEHRSVTGPDARHELPQPSYAEFGKTYFLQTIGPVYKKLDEVIKQAGAMFEAAQRDYQLLVRWTSEGVEAVDNYREEAQNIFEQMTEEFERMKSEEGMSPFFNLEHGLASDTENLATYAKSLLGQLQDNATGKITKAKETMKRILKRQVTIDGYVARVKNIPKSFQSDDKVKPILVQIALLHKEVGVYVKQMATYLKGGVDQFAKFRKEYEKQST